MSHLEVRFCFRRREREHGLLDDYQNLTQKFVQISGRLTPAEIFEDIEQALKPAIQLRYNDIVAEPPLHFLGGLQKEALHAETEGPLISPATGLPVDPPLNIQFIGFNLSKETDHDDIREIMEQQHELVRDSLQSGKTQYLVLLSKKCLQKLLWEY